MRTISADMNGAVSELCSGMADKSKISLLLGANASVEAGVPDYYEASKMLRGKEAHYPRLYLDSLMSGEWLHVRIHVGAT